MAQGYDYVIIGAGSAGCVVAARLSENPDARVAVLEAGPSDRNLYMISMPAATAEVINSTKYNWAYRSEPEPYMDNRRIYYPRGKVLGGSSSINGMVFLRGNPLDYDSWASNRLDNWSYTHCLPYFKRMEKSSKGDDEFRGRDGPMEVTTTQTLHPLYEAYIEAAQQAGHPLTEDVNGYRQEGVFVIERTILGGIRNSTARAYLRPAMKRPNLTVETRAHIDRILFEGNRATGVVFIRDGQRHEIHADREVILCAGAFNSPQILKRSGIGPAAELAEHGIDVVCDCPGVGENLQDHLEWPIQYSCNQPISYYSATTKMGQIRTGLEWFLLKSGVGASNLFDAGGFYRSRPDIPWPNVQNHFVAIAMNYDGSMPERGHGYQSYVSQMRPTSRGHVRLRSSDPFDTPRIQFNHMQTENDRRELREAVRVTREIFAQKAFDPYRGRELSPGDDITSNADIDAFLRATAETEHHPSSTCKMGYDDMAVVDKEARVHGVEGLRVVDTSIMPDVVTANLNATCIMLGEKVSDLIAGKEPLEPQYAWYHRADVAAL